MIQWVPRKQAKTIQVSLVNAFWENIGLNISRVFFCCYLLWFGFYFFFFLRSRACTKSYPFNSFKTITIHSYLDWRGLAKNKVIFHGHLIYEVWNMQFSLVNAKLFFLHNYTDFILPETPQLWLLVDLCMSNRKVKAIWPWVSKLVIMVLVFVWFSCSLSGVCTHVCSGDQLRTLTS